MYNSFQPQKVLHLDKALSLKVPKINGDYILTEKFEGWYVTIYYDGEKFHNPRSSNGREIPAFSWLADRLNNKCTEYTVPFVLIAEAYLENTPFEILNGIFNKSKGDCWCHDVIFKIHDFVRLDIAIAALERFTSINYLLARLNLHYLQKPELLHIGKYEADVWQRYFDEIANKGGEGIVAKRVGAFYQQGKRNSDLLKLKLECTIDALAVDLIESYGEKNNPSLTLVSRRKNGTEIHTVISKHSDQQLFRANSSNVLGKVVQLKAMQEYADGQLRQAVFQHIREDKLPNDID